MTGTYDLSSVALSVVIALFAAFVALDVGGRVTASRGKARAAWLAGGAIAMGFGIWSMHYVGMVAFQLPITVVYDVPTVVLSLVIAIVASGVAGFVVSRGRLGVPEVVLGGLLMGSGIAGMHYVGMAAMRLPAVHYYDPLLVALSVVLAIGTASVALVVIFRARHERALSTGRKLASAVLMGSAIPLMHYTGMAAVSFTPSDVPVERLHGVSVSSLGGWVIGAFTLVLLGLVMGTAMLDRFVAAQRKQREADWLFRQLAGERDGLLADEIHLKDEFLATELRQKDELLSHVSHELRSPLASIHQFVAILLDNVAGELNAEQRQYLEVVRRNASQLGKLLDDLVDAARGQSGKLRVQLERLSLAEAITDVLHTLQLTAAAKSISLDSNVQGDLPAAVADPTRTRQILVNLTQNAIKFTQENGAITLRARVLENDPAFLVVSVTDTGCGLAPAMQERVFDRLFQVENPSGAHREGLGLGLFLCKQLVQLQGGRIWVESELGRGSTFSFTLRSSLLPEPAGALAGGEGNTLGAIRMAPAGGAA